MAESGIGRFVDPRLPDARRGNPDPAARSGDRSFPHADSRRQTDTPGATAPAQLGIAALIAVVALIGAVVAVFRVTLPDVRPLALARGEAFPEATSARFEMLPGGYSGTRLVSGNRIDLLLNGDGRCSRLWEDLRSGNRSITFQTYIGSDPAGNLSGRIDAAVVVCLIPSERGPDRQVRKRLVDCDHFCGGRSCLLSGTS